MPVGLFPVESLFFSIPSERSMTVRSELYEFTTYKNLSSELKESPAGPFPVFKVSIILKSFRSITVIKSDHWFDT